MSWLGRKKKAPTYEEKQEALHVAEVQEDGGYWVVNDKEENVAHHLHHHPDDEHHVFLVTVSTDIW